MRKFVKFGLLLLLAFSMIFSVAAGGRKEGTTEDAGSAEPNVLRIRSVGWLTKKAFIDEAAEQFMAAHPGVKIEFESFEGADVNKYIIQWSSGKSDVDLLVVENPESTTAFIMKDMLFSFDELGLWDRFPKENLVKSILDVGIINDKTYYLPIMGEIYWFNINKKLLQDAGVADADGNIPVPATWNDMIEMAGKATGGDQAGMSIRLDTGSIRNSFYSALKGLRGSVFEADGITLAVDTPESREILQAWKKGIDEGWITTATMTDRNAGRVAYKAGKLPMLYESGSRWPEAAPLIGSNNTAPLPYPGGLENGSMLFIAGFAIPKQSKAPKLAMQFIEEIYLTDLIQSKMLNTYGKMPSLKSAYAYATSPEWDQMLTAAQNSSTFPQYREGNIFYSGMADDIQAYLLGKTDLDSCLKSMQQRLDKIDKRIY